MARAPLHEAIASDGSVESIRSMLSSGADVNAKDHDGEAPLHLAVSRNNLAIARLLLDHGASVNGRNDSQQTPLHRVRWATHEAVAMLDLLLSNGADVNAEDFSASPLHLAVARDNVTAVRALIEHGASIDRKDRSGRTPLHRAIESTVSAGLVDLLLSSGADPNAKSSKGETPLHLAVLRENVSAVRSLLQRGALIDCEDEDRRTPLHRAVIRSAVDIVELLLVNEADANARDREGNRPLHHAIPKRPTYDGRQCRHLLFVLLKKRAYVNARNNDGKSALYLALKHENEMLVDALWEFGADVEDPNVRDLILTTSRRLTYSSYLIKARIADLPLGKYATDNYRRFCDHHMKKCMTDECLKEIEKLKETSVHNRKSLYDFLRMPVSRRAAYTSSEKLRRLVNHSSLEKEFPLYAAIILAGYREAVTWKSLSKAAEEALCAITQVRLLDVVEHILGFLNDGDLICVIEANEDL